MNTNKKFSSVLKIGLTTLVLSSTLAVAEEGGSGHYLPGAISSFIDGAPKLGGVIVRLNYLNYQGSSSAALPFSDKLVANVDAKSNALALTVLWSPRLDHGIEDLHWAVTATIPVLNMDISGDVAHLSQGGDRTALGDIVFSPLMVNYDAFKNIDINFRVNIYAPTGSYDVDRLINNGKNFWTVEPTIGFMYFGQENGIEASLFFGADFNWENPDTNYKSGTQIHLDGTLAQHFPFMGGLAGAGVTGYWYDQVTGDSGSGATFGDFKAEAAGVGPVISWAEKTGKYVGELKYLRDFHNEKRLDSDIVWLKLIAKF